jgi:hypothetical protein
VGAKTSLVKVTPMQDRYKGRRCPEQPSSVVEIRLDRTRGELLEQWKEDRFVFASKRWVLASRRMSEAEIVEFRLHIPPGRVGVVVTALCVDCDNNRLYMCPVLAPPDAWELTANLGAPHILARLEVEDAAAARFFRHITKMHGRCAYGPVRPRADHDE